MFLNLPLAFYPDLYSVNKMYKKPISEVISMIVGFGLYHKFAVITWLHMHQVKL